MCAYPLDIELIGSNTEWKIVLINDKNDMKLPYWSEGENIITIETQKYWYLF